MPPKALDLIVSSRAQTRLVRENGPAFSDNNVLAGPHKSLP
jgi:hypothetical protein